jgi:hypothetical protein
VIVKPNKLDEADEVFEFLRPTRLTGPTINMRRMTPMLVVIASSRLVWCSPLHVVPTPSQMTAGEEEGCPVARRHILSPPTLKIINLVVP